MQALGGAGVDPWIETEFRRSDQVEFVVEFKDEPDLADLHAEHNTLERRKAVIERLQNSARSSQAGVRQLLVRRDIEHRAFWITNAIWIRGDRALLDQIAGRNEVAYVHGNRPMDAKLPRPDTGPRRVPAGIEWNIALIGAPDVWNQGVTGAGAVVGGQDTGYQWDHSALINQYRGWDGKSADHNYNWHDAIHEDNAHCDADSTFPCDDDGHGTHTMGIMVGDDSMGNQIGVAPGAKWIGCRNMNQGVGTPASYMECFQWFVAPTNLNGENPDPSKAPDIINNSWSCIPDEGCNDPDLLLETVQNVLAAGLLVVVSAGNGGSECNTVSNPPTIYSESFSVGSTEMDDSVSSFSSRGPVTVDESDRLKPNVSAPGRSILSSIPSDSYGAMSGTSMAAPHVAGLAALMISANPVLAGDPATIRARIESNAVPLTTEQECGGVPGSQVPNNTFGHGRIDAFRSVFDLWFLNGFESGVQN